MKLPGLICTFFVFAMVPLWGRPTVLATGCDTLITHDGKVLLVKIKRVTDIEVIYTKCHHVDKTRYSCKVTDLREIKSSRFQLVNHTVIQLPDVNKVYQTWVFTQTSRIPIKGLLHHTTDSSIILLDTEHKMFGSASSHPILITDIKKIAFRRKGNTGHGALAGGFFGMCLGTFLSFAFGDADSAVNTIVITPSGMLMGILGGSARNKIRLDGNLEIFQRHRASIRQYSLTRQ